MCTTYTQTTCPTAYWGDTSTSKCVPCGLNEWSPTGSIAVSACVCATNFYDDGTRCASCNSGTSPAGSTSAAACTCDANFYNDGVTCVSCGASGTSVAGSTEFSACVCNANFYNDGTRCFPCGASGTSAAGATSAAACTCAENFYNDGTQCAPCGAGTSSAESTGFASCTCDANPWSTAGTPPYSTTYRTSYACVTLPGGMCPSGAVSATECTCVPHTCSSFQCANGPRIVNSEIVSCSAQISMLSLFRNKCTESLVSKDFAPAALVASPLRLLLTPPIMHTYSRLFFLHRDVPYSAVQRNPPLSIL